MQLLIDLILEVIWCPLSAQSTCDITISPKERRLRIKISQTLLYSQESTWLPTCLHPRNLSYDKRVHLYQICAVMLVERCPISLAKLGGQSMYNLCSTWCWTSMLWSIDSCQNRYQLTSVTWLYCGLRCTTRLVDVFFSSLVTSHWFSIDDKFRSHFFSGGIQFASYLLSKFDESFAFSLG